MTCADVCPCVVRASTCIPNRLYCDIQPLARTISRHTAPTAEASAHSTGSVLRLVRRVAVRQGTDSTKGTHDGKRHSRQVHTRGAALPAMVPQHPVDRAQTRTAVLAAGWVAGAQRRERQIEKRAGTRNQGGAGKRTKRKEGGISRRWVTARAPLDCSRRVPWQANRRAQPCPARVAWRGSAARVPG